MVTEGLYVYCVIGAGEARNFGPIGIGGRGDAVTTIAYRDLSAVVSTVPMNKYVVGHETMLSHERALETVMKDYTVLPMRFYTVAPNAEEIRGLLRARYVELKRLLREMDGKVEMGLKALWKDMRRLLREIAEEGQREKGLAASETIPDSGTEPDKWVRPALDAKKANMRELLLMPFRPLADKLCLNRTYGDDMIMNAAFLVDRAREREFDARMEQLSMAYSDTIEFKYVGPAPFFSFVNIVIKEETITGGVLGEGR